MRKLSLTLLQLKILKIMRMSRYQQKKNVTHSHFSSMQRSPYAKHSWSVILSQSSLTKYPMSARLCQHLSMSAKDKTSFITLKQLPATNGQLVTRNSPTLTDRRIYASTKPHRKRFATQKVFSSTRHLSNARSFCNVMKHCKSSIKKAISVKKKLPARKYVTLKVFSLMWVQLSVLNLQAAHM